MKIQESKECALSNDREKRYSFWKIFIVVVLPALIAFGIYFNTLKAEFVHDDNLQIVDNPWVHDFKHLPQLLTHPVWSFRSQAPSNYYRPVQMLLYTFLWVIFGGRPFPFHLMNVLLHLLMTIALALFIYRLSNNHSLSFGAALLFAVHPVNTEAVAWVACLPELSYSLLTILVLYLHGSAWVSHTCRGAFLRKGLALLASAVAMFCKETALILVPLVFLLELWVRPTLSPPERQRKGSKHFLTSDSSIGKRFLDSKGLISSIRATAPYALILIGYLIIRWFILGGLAPMSRVPVTTMDILMNAPLLFLSYIRIMVLPVGLLAYHIFEPLPSLFHPGFLIGLPMALLIPLTILYLFRHEARLAFAVLLVCLPLLPVLYIPGVGSNVFAEHYAYLSSAGLTWVFVGSMVGVAKRLAKAHDGSAFIVTIVILLALPLSLMSLRRNQDWLNDERLARSTLSQEPRATIMYVVLGNYYQRKKLWDQALSAYEAGIKADPQRVLLRASAINLRLNLGKISPEEAIDEYNKLALDNPKHYELQAILGDAYLRAGRLADAEKSFLRAIEINPQDGLLYNRLAVVYVEMGQLQEAHRALIQALKIDPDLKVARRNLDRVQEMMQNSDR